MRSIWFQGEKLRFQNLCYSGCNQNSTGKKPDENRKHWYTGHDWKARLLISEDKQLSAAAKSMSEIIGYWFITAGLANPVGIFKTGTNQQAKARPSRRSEPEKSGSRKRKTGKKAGWPKKGHVGTRALERLTIPGPGSKGFGDSGFRWAQLPPWENYSGQVEGFGKHPDQGWYRIIWIIFPGMVNWHIQGPRVLGGIPGFGNQGNWLGPVFQPGRGRLNTRCGWQIQETRVFQRDPQITRKYFGAPGLPIGVARVINTENHRGDNIYGKTSKLRYTQGTSKKRETEQFFKSFHTKGKAQPGVI